MGSGVCGTYSHRVKRFTTNVFLNGCYIFVCPWSKQKTINKKCFHYPGAMLVIDINRCLEEQKSGDILPALKSSPSHAQDVIFECADRYYKALRKAKESKSKKGKHCHYRA